MDMDNPLELAIDYNKTWQIAVIAELQFFNKNYLNSKYNELIKKYNLDSYFIRDYIDHYGIEIDPKTKKAIFTHLDTYPELWSFLDSRKHQFQSWLEESAHYKNAISKFRKKNIACPVYYERNDNTISLICIEACLDNLIAESMIRWNDLKISNIEAFVRLDKKHTNKISKKAQELLDAIQEAPVDIRLSKTARRVIEDLANKKSGMRPLEISHIPKSYLRFEPKTKHCKSDREFLVREIISKYMKLFGMYELKKNKSDKALNLVDYPRFRTSNNPKHDLDEQLHYWEERLSPVAHSDVILPLLLTIDDSFEDITERKIYEYANKQKISDGYIT